MSRTLAPVACPEVVRPFVDAGVLGAAEVHLARILSTLALPNGRGATHSEMLVLCFSAWASRVGHVCLDLGDIRGQVLSDMGSRVSEANRLALESLHFPVVDELDDDLTGSPLFGVAHDDPSLTDTTRPLVRKGNLVYLTRQWVDEGIVGQLLSTRFSAPSQVVTVDAETWSRAPFADPDGIDSAQVAAVRAVLAHRTVVLLGGPGTGKTYTIAAMLHALAERRSADGGTPLRVALAAPTAKAAQQMTSSINGSLSEGNFPPTHAEAIAGWAATSSTLHSLLGVRAGNLVRFRHDSRHRLRHDVVIVDEVSMVSLPLMARLLEAVPHDATLVLVGDPQQLQSIETGAVLGDVEQMQESLPHIVVLRENRRQRLSNPDGSSTLNAIGRLAAEMRPPVGMPVDVESVLAGLRDPGDDSVLWIETDDNSRPTAESVVDRLSGDLQGFSSARQAALSVTSNGDVAAHAALSFIESVRILCAHREGDWGVSGWNTVAGRLTGVNDNPYAPGRPLLVTRNDRSAGLNNGDTGVVVGSSGRQAALRAHNGNGTDRIESVRRIDMSSLTDIETAFAMTVHKSQGSQYDTVVFVVPPLTSPLLQRELLYTAVTRARTRLVIVGSEASLARALETRSMRRSNLAERIATTLT